MEEFELEPGEEVVQSVRQHPFVFVLRLIPLVILLFVPAFIGTFFSFLASASPQATMAFASITFPANAVRFAKGLLYLGVWTTAFSMFTRNYLTVWVITNLRIVDIKQYSFFNREVSSFLLIRVQDITTEVSGLLGTLVGFGSLSVETAGKDEEFRMDTIPNPEKVRDVIMSQVAQLHEQNGVAAGV